MTKEKRVEKLRHFITCLKCEVSGKCCDNNCPTQYNAGNMREIIENLEEIAKALEQEPRKDEVILTNKEYRELIANEYDNGYCKGYLVALEEQEPIIDKIRAEISTVYESLDGYDPDSLGAFVSKIDEIFDRYKAESEADNG